MERWPRMILQTYEMAAIIRGLQDYPAANTDQHVFDFEDGVRLLISVNQESIGSPELLEVALSLASECEMLGVESATDHWLRVLTEHLIDIDPSERPRAPKRHLLTSSGIIIALYDFHRAQEEQAARTALLGKGMSAAPLNYLPMATIYARPHDYPEVPYVIRRNSIVAGEIIPSGGWGAPTLDAARALIPRHMVNIGRHAPDAPNIVETWV